MIGSVSIVLDAILGAAEKLVEHSHSVVVEFRVSVIVIVLSIVLDVELSNACEEVVGLVDVVLR